MSDLINKQWVLAIAKDSCLDLDNWEDNGLFCEEIEELPPADIMECARAIKSFCSKQQYKCASCKFQLFDEEVGFSVCGLEVTTPLGWDLPEGRNE